MALAALAASAAAPAAAQAPEKADALGQCLIANSTPEHETLLKTTLIHALQDETELLNGSVLQMSLAFIGTAQSKCGVKLTDLEADWFTGGIEKYAEFLGGKVVGDALAKLGG